VARSAKHEVHVEQNHNGAGSYALYARSFSLIASGWIPEDVSFNCFSPLKWLFYGGNRSIAGFDTF